jgi:hypothetical protein
MTENQNINYLHLRNQEEISLCLNQQAQNVEVTNIFLQIKFQIHYKQSVDNSKT